MGGNEGLNNKFLSLSAAESTNVNVKPGQPNPFTFWIWMIVDQTQSRQLAEDPEIQKMNDAVSVLLNCQIAVYNITYAILNGTLDTTSVQKELADPLSSYVVMDPLSFTFGDREIYQKLKLHAAVLNSARDVAAATSRTVSEVAMAYVAGVFESTENNAQTRREDIAVARISVSVVALILLFGYVMAIEGLVLMILAAWNVKTRPEAVDERAGMKLEALVNRPTV